MIEQEKYNIRGFPFVIVALAMALCTFMEVLDFSITNVAIPYIAGDLGVSDDNGTWVVTFFMVGNATVLPISGWLSEKIGAVKLIILSSILFGVASFLCGIAINFQMLVVFRFFQGLVAGPLIPLSQTLLVKLFPRGKETMAIALWSMVTLVGPISGPILGGWITQTYSWRWIFFINLPVAAFCFLAILAFMKQYLTKITDKKFDWWGFFFLIVGITCLQIFLDQGRNLDWLHSPITRTLLATAIVSLVLLVVYEWNHDQPLIEVKLLKIPSFAMGTLILGISFMVFFAPLVVTPLWLENYMGYDALKAGICLATMGIIPFFFAPIIGKLMRFGYHKLMMAISFTLMAFAFLYFTTFDTQVSFSKIAWSRFYLGFGLCCYMAPAIALPLVKIPPDKKVNAAGIMQFFRIFMSGAGTSIFTALWYNRATFYHERLGSYLNDFNHNLNQIRNTIETKIGFSEKAYLTQLNRMVDQQAFMLSTNEIMLACGITLLFMTGLLLFVKVSRKECQTAKLPVG